MCILGWREGGGISLSLYIYIYIYMCCLSFSGPCIPFRVMVKDKRMVILYAIISCDQPLFTLYFSVWEILRGFYSPFNSLSLSLSPLYFFHLSLSFYLSFSLSPSLSLLSIILIGVSMDVFVLVLYFNNMFLN